MAKSEAKPPKDRIPRVGDTVRWYPDGQNNQMPAVALVMDQQNGTLKLSVWSARAMTPRPLTGVRHISHPLLKENPNVARESGGWDWTESALELHKVLDALAE